MEITNCPNCKHYLSNLSCLAFPERIPDEILEGENAHEKPLKEQFNDLVFEPVE